MGKDINTDIEELDINEAKLIKGLNDVAYHFFRERRIDELRGFLNSFSFSELKFLYEGMNYVTSYISSKEGLIREFLFAYRTREYKELSAKGLLPKPLKADGKKVYSRPVMASFPINAKNVYYDDDRLVFRIGIKWFNMLWRTFYEKV